MSPTDPDTPAATAQRADAADGARSRNTSASATCAATPLRREMGPTRRTLSRRAENPPLKSPPPHDAADARPKAAAARFPAFIEVRRPCSGARRHAGARGPPPEVGLPRGRDLIEARDRRLMRRREHERGVRLGFPG